jgi:hypothetical protein
MIAAYGYILHINIEIFKWYVWNVPQIIGKHADNELMIIDTEFWVCGVYCIILFTLNFLMEYKNKTCFGRGKMLIPDSSLRHFYLISLWLCPEY